MKYDFDKIIERRNTNSLKYDFSEKRGLPKDVLPLWVADMDFRTCDEVIAALHEKAEHGIFGYSEPLDEYYCALLSWFSSRHSWNPDPKRFVLTCGIVFSLCSLIRTLTKKGDAVLICQPVYYPFEESIVENGRKLVVSELRNENGHYVFDYDDFERKITENNVKVFILCNPHNPVGRVWTREELEHVGNICLKHGVFVIADEIHEDFVYEGHRHTVFVTIRPEFEKNCAVCTAPSKTFNLAGLHNSNIYIADDKIREKFVSELNAQGYSQSNVMGIVACQAAYRYGQEWLDELLSYLTGNIAFVKEYLKENLPQISMTEPEGTYLLWLDCRKLALSDRELRDLIRNKAGLWLDDGFIFGKGGSGFQRINIACPRSVLKEALEKLKHAVEICT